MPSTSAPRRIAMRAAAIASLVAAAVGSTASADEPSAGELAVHLRTSSPESWLTAADRLIAEHPQADDLRAKLNMGRLVLGIYGVDAAKPVAATAFYPEAEAMRRNEMAAPSRFLIRAGTLRLRRFERFGVQPNSPGQLYVDLDAKRIAPLPETMPAYAASDGETVLLTDARETATAARLAEIGPPERSLLLAESTAEIEVGLSMRAVSPAFRDRIRREIAEGFKTAARRQFDRPGPSAIERRLSLESLRLLQSAAAAWADLDSALIAAGLDDASRMAFTGRLAWADDDVLATLGEMAPLEERVDAVADDRVLVRSDLHLTVSQRTAVRLSRLIELIGQQVRDEARRNETLPYLAPSIDQIEDELLETLRARRLVASLAVLAEGERAGVLFAMRTGQPVRIDAAIRGFLTRVRSAPAAEAEANGVRWLRFPSDEEAADGDERPQPFWLGHDRDTLWMLVAVGRGRPRLAIGRAERARSRRELVRRGAAAGSHRRRSSGAPLDRDRRPVGAAAGAGGCGRCRPVRDRPDR